MAPRAEKYDPATYLKPDREQLATYIQTLFKHATLNKYYTSLRTFFDDRQAPPFIIRPLLVTIATMIERAYGDAEAAANNPNKLVFAPPIATFTNAERAGEADLAEGLTLSVECDAKAAAARVKLEALLGVTTLVVASGGDWIDNETGEVEPKLHQHYRLKVPARSQEEHAKLKQARDLAARLVGGDTSNVPIVHCLRWAGSWHRKGEPKLCHIVALNPDAEIDLDEALERLRDAVGAEAATEQKQEQKPKPEQPTDTEAPNWGELIREVLSTESFHKPLNRLAAKLIKSGMHDGATVNMLRGLMLNVDGPQDERWKARFDDIARAVSSARKKFGGTAEFQQQQPLFDPWARFVVPGFPTGVLAGVAQDFAGAQAELIGVDEASMAMCVLTTFSGALSHEFRLKMMQHGDWYVTPRIWLLLFGDSSTKKTPAFNTATAPLEDYQIETQRAYHKALRLYEEFKKLAKELAKAGEQVKEPEPPPRYVVWNSTIEKLGDLLARSPRGLLVKSDELSGWLGAMEKYGGAKGGKADRAFWLKAYDGGASGVDRMGRGETFVENLSVSHMGGIQPDRLAEIPGLASDGLLPRFTPTVMGPATLPVDRPCDSTAYNQLVRALIAAVPADLLFTPAALEAMADLRKYLHELKIHANGVAQGFVSFIGKLEGVTGNLALILHMTADPLAGGSKPVELGTAERVRKLVLDFILPHALEFYRSAESASNGDRLKRLASWILTSGKLRFVVSDLTSNVAELRGLTLFEVNERVSPLRAAGWLAPEDAKLGPQNRAWFVNPAVFKQFADRVGEEEAAKAKLAELMNSPRRQKR